MKTKNKKSRSQTEVFTVGPDPATTEETTIREETASVKPKLSVPLREDGSFDLDSMRASTIDKLKQAIAGTPGVSATVNSGASGVVMEFPPMVIYTLYGGIGAVEAMIASFGFKVPRTIADSVFTYTPDELNALVPPTSRVLSKYASDWMIKYQDEIALAGLLTTITLKKVQMCIMLSRQSQENVVEMPKKDGDDQDIKLN